MLLHALHGDRSWPVSRVRSWIAAAVVAQAVVLSAATPPSRAATFVVTLPDVKPIPVTATSHPWLYYKATQRPLDLDKLGFVEEEFLVSGTANVYDWPAD